MLYRFLYQLYIAIDANFKLKAKSQGAKAVMLSDSYTYIVQDADYASHLSESTDDMLALSLAWV
jgi:nitrate reductase alpha subunit